MPVVCPRWLFVVFEEMQPDAEVEEFFKGPDFLWLTSQLLKRILFVLEIITHSAAEGQINDTIGIVFGDTQTFRDIRRDDVVNGHV